MLNFLLNILFLMETLAGIELFCLAIFQPIHIFGVNIIVLFIGIVMSFDGLERLDKHIKENNNHKKNKM